MTHQESSTGYDELLTLAVDVAREAAALVAERRRAASRSRTPRPARPTW